MVTPLWVVPELGTDFTEDFEDLIISYIYSKWSISDPPKGTAMQPDTITEPDALSFKPGFPDYFRPYELNVIQTRTEPLHNWQHHRFLFTTALEIMLRMKRLNRDAAEVDPQLENMELETNRIIMSYLTQNITGIKDVIFDLPNSLERVYGATDTYAKTDWRSVVRIKILYEKAEAPEV